MKDKWIFNPTPIVWNLSGDWMTMSRSTTEEELLYYTNRLTQLYFTKMFIYYGAFSKTVQRAKKSNPFPHH